MGRGPSTVGISQRRTVNIGDPPRPDRLASRGLEHMQPDLVVLFANNIQLAILWSRSPQEPGSRQRQVERLIHPGSAHFPTGPATDQVESGQRVPLPGLPGAASTKGIESPESHRRWRIPQQHPLLDQEDLSTVT